MGFEIIGGILNGPILLPMVIAGAGVIISIIGTMLVSINDNEAKEDQVMAALNKGNITSIILGCNFMLFFYRLYVTRNR